MIFEKVALALAERAGVEKDTITLETSFQDLDLDSLDTVDVLMGLEDQFGVTLELSEGLRCVADVVALIEQGSAKA